jgi:hypothetical protein
MFVQLQKREVTITEKRGYSYRKERGLSRINTYTRNYSWKILKEKIKEV